MNLLFGTSLFFSAMVAHKLHAGNISVPQSVQIENGKGILSIYVVIHYCLIRIWRHRKDEIHQRNWWRSLQIQRHC